jgi:membrane protease YdiL (CAAX protease family)
MDQKPVISYLSQLAFLLGLVGVSMVLCGGVLGLIASSVMNVPVKEFGQAIIRPENANISRLLNTITALLVFGLPTYILARIISKKPFAQMGFSSATSFKQLALVLALIFVSLFVSGALGQLNEWIPIPHGWRVWAQQVEAENKASMMSMATMKSFADYLIALLVLAFFPAMFEEILFRGGLQQVMVGLTKNKWAGIIITSVLFSAIHISYFGFLPRLALGMVLGLIFYYSKNIWLSILMHFLNNALVVTQLYVMSQQGKPLDKAADENMPVWMGLVALVVLIMLFRAFRKESATVLANKELDIHSSPENIIS